MHIVSQVATESCDNVNATKEKQSAIGTEVYPREQESLIVEDAVVLLEEELRKIRTHMTRLQMRVDELEDQNPCDSESLPKYNQVISRR